MSFPQFRLREPRLKYGSWARMVSGAGVIGLLLWLVGLGPFLDGVRLVDGSTLVAALGIGIATTVCSAWRWSLVAAGLGVRLPVRTAAAAYYRSQFLNTTLPGGVLGDVHRAVRHGLDIGDVGLGVRTVMLERIAGQAVTAVLAMLVLFVFPSPVRSHMPAVTIGILAAAVGVVVAARALPRGRWARAVGAVGSDIHNGLLSRRTWVGVVIASTVVVAGHLTAFVLAARTAGATAPLTLLVPLILLALLAMVLPLSVAGWGAREGVAAWVFGAAGLTSTQGVTTAVTYGVLVLVASLPGVAVLLARWIGREREPALVRAPALQQDGAHG